MESQVGKIGESKQTRSAVEILKEITVVFRRSMYSSTTRRSLSTEFWK